MVDQARGRVTGFDGDLARRIEVTEARLRAVDGASPQQLALQIRHSEIEIGDCSEEVDPRSAELPQIGKRVILQSHEIALHNPKLMTTISRPVLVVPSPFAA